MQNKTYTYEVTSIKRSVKNGKLNISNLEGMLYLTTCDQVLKGYQLTVEASLIKWYNEVARRVALNGDI